MFWRKRNVSGRAGGEGICSHSTHPVLLCLAFSSFLLQVPALLRLTMDKSSMAKSNYEEKLHSCPRNHLCQGPHKETQSLLK